MAEEKVDPSEVWIPIPGIPDYEASSLGRIRSIGRYRKFGKITGWLKGRVLKPVAHHSGWGQYYLRFEGNGRLWSVHRSVCLAFHGDPPSPEYEVAHFDSDTMNNRESNIGWVTPLENAAHKEANGTHPRGQNNGFSKLTEIQVYEIIRLRAAGQRADLVASKFGVTAGHIRDISSGRCWTHIPRNGAL